MCYFTALSCLIVEGIDEELSDSLSLVLGIGFALEGGKEGFLGIGLLQSHVEVFSEKLEYVFRLMLSQHAVVDEDTYQSVPDRPVDQDGGN